MSINFIPNDPLAVAMAPMRKIRPRRNRTATQAGFSFAGAAAEGVFEPGTPPFLFWQCREAALLSVAVWERLTGPLRQWSEEARDSKRLRLIQDRGDDLNAFYDRDSLSFFHHTTGGHTTFSGASTDVVSHEAGHAFLDAMRPDLFGSAITEHGAFHEAFADCMAILVALADARIRTALLQQSPDLGTANFVEATAEDLSDAVRRSEGANHPAAAPRRALNSFRFQLPATLPTSGGPNVLTSEIHSFGRVFSGCFYDVIRNIFNASPARNAASLLAASSTAGRLLIEGARQAPAAARFFQAVGRAMVLSDDATYRSANRQAIGQAFARHGVMLGSMSALMPEVALAGRVPAVGARVRTASLDTSTLKDIRRRIHAAPGARLDIASCSMGRNRFVNVIHHREVDLSALAKELNGVVAIALEPVIVGASGGSAAAFNAMPDASATSDEVLKFVETLLADDRIELKESTSSGRSQRGGRRLRTGNRELPTHTIRRRGAKKVLIRTRFLCRCGR